MPHPNQEGRESLLTTKQAAELLGQSDGTLRRWRSVRTGPTYVQLSPRNVRYRKSDVLRYIAEKVRTPHVHAA
jgi:predicted DNA-binding transcriptional regulator AlpA